MKVSRVGVGRMFLRGSFLLPLLLGSLPACATVGVVRTEVWPPVRQAVIAAGPNLVEALASDVAAILGWPVEQGLGLLGLKKSVPGD